MSLRIDLHTHSELSYDGGISKKQYGRIFKEKMLDVVAITDHNEIKLAEELEKEFGEKIIIGEEIDALEGEIVGLYLKRCIPGGLNVRTTVRQIHKQGGLVYIPHPFEKLRKGLKEDALEKIKDEVDIIEVFNARARWRGEGERAMNFANKFDLTKASSSDAHCMMGVGFSYSMISDFPKRNSLVKLLRGSKLEKSYAPMISYLCPGINKIGKNFKINLKTL